MNNKRCALNVCHLNKKRKTLILFAILLILTNLIFIPWLTGHMATDSYNIYNLGYEEWSKTNSLLDARFFVVLYTSMMNYFQVPIQTAGIIMLELNIVLSCITIVLLTKMAEKYKTPKNLWSRILLIIACYYAIFHFMYIENLHYMECGIMALSITFYILAAKQIVEKPKLWIIKLFLLLCLALMCYQGTISVFFLTLAVFSMIKGENIKNIIKNFAQGIGICLVTIFVNQLEIKAVEQIYHIQQARGINFSVIGNNIAFIIYNLYRVLRDVGHYLPRHSYLIILVITEVLIFLQLFNQNRKKARRQKYYHRVRNSCHYYHWNRRWLYRICHKH